MGKQNTMVYASLINDFNEQVFLPDDTDTIFFVKMDRNYKVV